MLKGGKILECIYVPKDKQLTLKIAEEIDEHTTEKLRRKIDNEITRFCLEKLYLILVTLLSWTVQE